MAQLDVRVREPTLRCMNHGCFYNTHSSRLQAQDLETVDTLGCCAAFSDHEWQAQHDDLQVVVLPATFDPDWWWGR